MEHFVSLRTAWKVAATGALANRREMVERPDVVEHSTVASGFASLLAPASASAQGMTVTIAARFFQPWSADQSRLNTPSFT